MRHPIWAVWTLAGVLAAGPAVAGDSAAVTADRVKLSYTVYFGGLHVIDLNIALDLAPTSYDVQTRIQTVGLARWVTEWSLASKTQGTVVDGLRLQPHRHRVSSEFRGRPRSVAIDFDAGGVTEVRIVPPPREDDNRDEVPRALMHGTVDPTSALLAVTRRIAATGGCAGRVPVFDGRRRYDVVVIEQGMEDLPPSDYALFNGQALRCDFSFEPIAGYDIRAADPEQRKRRFRSGRAWFAELMPGRPAVPVRIEIDGDLAPTLAHLRDVQSLGPAAAAEQID